MGVIKGKVMVVIKGLVGLIKGQLVVIKGKGLIKGLLLVLVQLVVIKGKGKGKGKGLKGTEKGKEY